MNSRQTNFLLTSNDQLSLLRALRSIGDFRIVTGLAEGGSLEFLDDTALAAGDMSNPQSYLVRPLDVSAIRLRNISGRSYKSIDETLSPVVEFWRCTHVNNELRRGRMYVVSAYYEGEKLLRKEEDFLRWTAKLMSMARRRLKKDPASFFYYGEEAWQLRGSATKFPGV